MHSSIFVSENPFPVAFPVGSPSWFPQLVPPVSSPSWLPLVPQLVPSWFAVPRKRLEEAPVVVLLPGLVAHAIRPLHAGADGPEPRIRRLVRGDVLEVVRWVILRIRELSREFEQQTATTHWHRS